MDVERIRRPDELVAVSVTRRSADNDEGREDWLVEATRLPVLEPDREEDAEVVVDF